MLNLDSSVETRETAPAHSALSTISTEDPRLNETGVVFSVVGEIATVHIQNQLACSSCKVVDSCGSGIVEKFLSSKIFVTQMQNSLAAKAGDRVVVGIPQSSITIAATVVYLFPLFTMFLFSISFQSLGLDEGWIILAALLGLFVGLLFTKYYNLKILNSESYLPHMVSIIDTDGSSRDDRLKKSQFIPIVNR